MGVAAYNRGSRAIRAQIDRETSLAMREDPLMEENTKLARRLERARLSLRLASATLAEERGRARRALAEIRALRESFRGKGASHAHYIAIIAMLRVERALSTYTEER